MGFDIQYWCYSIYLRDLGARHFVRRFCYDATQCVIVLWVMRIGYLLGAAARRTPLPVNYMQQS